VTGAAPKRFVLTVPPSLLARADELIEQDCHVSYWPKADIGRHGFNTAFLLSPVTRCMMLHGIRRSSRNSWNDMSKDTLYGLGPHKFGVAGIQNGSTR
jgi:hypothetical protein